MYNEVAGPIVANVMDGFNGTVLAYGQTGTGKTYTMVRWSRRVSYVVPALTVVGVLVAVVVVVVVPGHSQSGCR